ncbi:GntR family transcriptional regulator [Streptomyces sp. BH097]|uniref:TetR/AcrR family transcriptional regulator n=1 Tax=unclassified Streptomyces TaxID=2593676 RepID=UPI003BB6C45F
MTKERGEAPSSGDARVAHGIRGKSAAEIVESVSVQVNDGRLVPGSALPPIRALAVELGVNRNTVAAAYVKLAAAGVVVTRGRGGTCVAPAAESRGQERGVGRGGGGRTRRSQLTGGGTRRFDALERLEAQVASFDWSGLTEGRRQILDAFLGIATTSGYASVTMRGIGKRLLVKAPSLYSHFPGGRDELVALALRWHYTRWAGSVVRAVREVEDPRAFLAALVRHHVRNQLETVENDMFDLLLATDRFSRMLPPRTRDEVAHLVSLYQDLYLGVVSDLGYGGDTSRVVAMAVTLLDGVRSWSGWEGDPGSLGGIVESAVRAVDALLNTLPAAGPGG